MTDGTGSALKIPIVTNEDMPRDEVAFVVPAGRPSVERTPGGFKVSVPYRLVARIVGITHE